MKQVFVVTNPELGWDCICAVYDAEVMTRYEVEEDWSKRSGFIVHQFAVETTIEKE